MPWAFHPTLSQKGVVTNTEVTVVVVTNTEVAVELGVGDIQDTLLTKTGINVR